MAVFKTPGARFSSLFFKKLLAYYNQKKHYKVDVFIKFKNGYYIFEKDVLITDASCREDALLMAEKKVLESKIITSCKVTKTIRPVPLKDLEL